MSSENLRRIKELIINNMAYRQLIFNITPEFLPVVYQNNIKLIICVVGNRKSENWPWNSAL